MNLISQVAARCFLMLHHVLLSWILGTNALNAASIDSAVDTTFSKANELLLSGKHTAAAQEYENLLRKSPRSGALHFNLAQTYLQLGRLGYSYAHLRAAELALPRNQKIQTLLAQLKPKLPLTPDTAFFGFLRRLTLEEGAVLALITVWTWFLLAVLKLISPTFAQRAGIYSKVVGIAAVLISITWLIAYWIRTQSPPGIVVAKETSVRGSPIEEARAWQKLPEGSEVTVLGKQLGWWKIRIDSEKRLGWVSSSDLMVIR